MAPRTVGMIGALCVLVGWALGTTVSPPVASLQTPASANDAPAASPVASRDSALTARLRARQSRTRAEAGQTSAAQARNPFRFGDAAPVPRESEFIPRAPVVSVQEPAAPPPTLIELSGIATTRRDGTDQRTAILLVNGVLQFAAAGDRLPDGSVVMGVRELETVLRDSTGNERVIRLR